jgi:hypothetical protein
MFTAERAYRKAQSLRRQYVGCQRIGAGAKGPRSQPVITAFDAPARAGVRFQHAGKGRVDDPAP